jgi:branched-chain amino acid transport system ATP-binding protein
MLEAKNLCAWYGAAQVLFDVAFTVERGEVVALMGRNGAGKSTTMKALMGLVGRRSGSVRFEGRELQGLETFEIARLGLGWVPEDRRIFTELTVLENLDVGRRPPNGSQGWTPERLFRLFPNLAEMRTRLGGRMSGGEQQMLTVARTLMGNPRMVLLDEPSEGVAPLVAERMADAILELKKEGLSILLSEQNLHFAELVSDRAYVLEKGHVGWAGSMRELLSSEDVQRQLLGV